MIRWIPAAAIATFVLGAPAAYAQTPAKDARSNRSAFPAGSIEGRVLDDSNSPVAGAMVSVVGRTTAAATTDRDGRYTLRELPYGPYILSVHSRGYFKSRGRTVQLTTSKVSIPEIQLQLASARKSSGRGGGAGCRRDQPAQVTQLAGFGLDSIAAAPRVAETAAAAQPAPAESETTTEHGETAWRLRHLPRSILKDAAADAVWAAGARPGAAMVQPPFGRGARADRVLQRPSAVRTAQPDDDRVVRSSRRDFRGARAAQRGVRLGQHAGGRRRVVDAGRDDAGRSVVVDRRRLLQVDRIDEPCLRAGPLLQHAALRRRQRGGARRHSRERPQCRQRVRLRRVDGVAAARAGLRHRLRPLRLSRRPGRVEPALQHHRARRRLPAEGARVAQGARARRRRVRAVGHRHVAAARAHVLVARRTTDASHPSRFATCRSRSSAISRRASPCRCAASISASTIS